MIIRELGRVRGELEGALPCLRPLRPQPRLGDDILAAQHHEGWTATAWLAGRVQGVVVQMTIERGTEGWSLPAISGMGKATQMASVVWG